MEYNTNTVAFVVTVVTIGIFYLTYYLLNRWNDSHMTEEETTPKLEEVYASSDKTVLPLTHGTLTTANASENVTFHVNIPVGVPDKNGNVLTREALDGALHGGNMMPFNIAFEPRVIKLKTGKRLMWGCSICPDKVYKHAPSAYNHINAKHK